MGRNRIQIEKIICPTKRRTTLAKRSRGLLKKAKELAVLCDVGVGLVIISPTGKPQLFSNRPWIERELERIHENSNEGNEAGMCSDDKEKCMGRCCESRLLEPEHPSLPLQAIETGHVNWTPDTNPSIGMQMQSAHNHIPMQQQQVVEAPQVREQAQMQLVPFDQMGNPLSIQPSVPRLFRSPELSGPYGGSDYMHGPLVERCEMPFSSGIHVSSSLWSLPEGEADKLEHSSNQPRTEQVLQWSDQNISPNMSGGHIAKLPVSGANPSYNVQSAHGHISMQQPQTVEARHDRNQVQILGVQGVPFAEMVDPCPSQNIIPNMSGEHIVKYPSDPSSIGTFVPGQFRPAEIRGQDGATDYMQGPLIGLCEMPYFCSVQPSLTTCDLPGGDAGKLEHYSNQPRREQMPQWLNQNIIHNMPEEETTNLEAPEDVHIQVPIQQTQEEKEAGMCSDDMEEWSDSLLESFLESKDPSCGVQTAEEHIPVQQPQVLERTEDVEQVQVQGEGVSLYEKEDPYLNQTSVPNQITSSEGCWPYGASDYIPSPPGVGWEMPFCSDEDMELATLRTWAAE